MLTFTKESDPVSLERLAGFLFLRLGLLILIVDLAGSTPPASPQDDKSSRGGAGTFSKTKKNRNLVSLPVLAGFCLLGDRLKHLDCQLVKAADRYDAPLVSRSAY